MCVRVLVHWNTTKTQSEVHHVYIHDAVRLRPDLSKLPPVDWQGARELDCGADGEGVIWSAVAKPQLSKH